MQFIEKIFKTLGFSKFSAEVYAELLKLKKSTARQLADNLGVPRPSVYDQLNFLIKEGLVAEFEIENKKYFQIENPNSLKKLLQLRIDVLESEKINLSKEIPKLLNRNGAIEPRVKFFAGRDGYRQVLTDILFHSGITIRAMWPYEEMTKVAGDEYLALWTKRRVREDIAVRSIWPFDSAKFKVKIPLEETRIAPKGAKWEMGYAIYDDKVAFISSRDESFGFTVQSKDFAQLQAAQFELVWELSQPLTNRK